MKLKFSCIMLALILCASFLAACGGGKNSDAPVINSPDPSASPTASASASTAPTASPTASPTATGTTDVPDVVLSTASDEDPEIAVSFKDLDKASALIVRGQFIEKKKDKYNAIRSQDDPSDPDPLVAIDEEQYVFKITEIYKNDKKLKTPLKAGDTIVVNTVYSKTYVIGKASTKDPRWMEMKLNEDTVLFLARYDTDPKNPVYRDETDIFAFSVKSGEKLYPLHADSKKVDEWIKKANAKDGVPIANLKKELGIK